MGPNSITKRYWYLNCTHECGLGYVAGILAVEYATGWLLRALTGACLWDYTGHNRWSVHGLISLDYARFGSSWARQRSGYTTFW